MLIFKAAPYKPGRTTALKNLIHGLLWHPEARHWSAPTTATNKSILDLMGIEYTDAP